MNQSEVNIGDWVVNKPDQSVIQIKTHWDIYSAKDFDPVEISPELLVKNGFEHNGDEYSLILNDCSFSKMRIEIEIKVGLSFITIYDFVDDWEIKKIDILVQYIHELQHILRLFKIDKKIKL